MKRAFKLFGIIVIMAVIGFSMTVCSSSDDSEDNSTWGKLSSGSGRWVMEGGPTIFRFYVEYGEYKINFDPNGNGGGGDWPIPYIEGNNLVIGSDSATVTFESNTRMVWSSTNQTYLPNGTYIKQ